VRLALGAVILEQRTNLVNWFGEGGRSGSARGAENPDIPSCCAAQTNIDPILTNIEPMSPFD